MTKKIAVDGYKLTKNYKRDKNGKKVFLHSAKYFMYNKKKKV